MSETALSSGYCFLCGSSVEGDINDHLNTEHPAPTVQHKAKKISWEHRLDNVIKAIGEIRQGTDRAAQVQKLDVEVIQELYLVRASLTQERRASATRTRARKE